MAKITLVRQNREITDAKRTELRAVLAVLYAFVDGLGELEGKKWRRFWSALLRMEIGEMAEIITHKARVGVYHRRHMLLEQRVFDAQERIAEFKNFRLWLKIGAGHVTWMAGPTGGVVPVPKSVAYEEMEQADFEEFHQSAVDFLRGEHAIKYLWPKLPAPQRHDAIEAVLGDFKSFGL